MNRCKFLLVALLCLAIYPSCKAEPPRTTRVLFIGNSYTYFNDLPEIFARLAEAGHQGKIETRMDAPGGTRLKDHWLKGDSKKWLEQEKWDYVVLQDQSTLGMDYWVKGKDHAFSDAVFRPYADKWVAEIRAHGAKPVFFMTWAGKNSPEDQPALTYAYAHAAKDSGSLLAPVGVAWDSLRREHTAIDLFYEGHGNHPSPAGSYLAACVLYATIFHQSPLSLPSKITGTPVNLDTEQLEVGKSAVLVDLSPGDATTLQNAAETTWKGLEKRGGYPEISAPAKPAGIEPLPKGIPVSISGLDGDWKGTILFYPVGPVDMMLHVHGLEARLELQYHSKNFSDESVTLSDLKIEGNQIGFTDPTSVGVDKLAVHFTAVLAERRELRGTADSRRKTEDADVTILGNWTLKKQ